MDFFCLLKLAFVTEQFGEIIQGEEGVRVFGAEDVSLAISGLTIETLGFSVAAFVIQRIGQRDHRIHCVHMNRTQDSLPHVKEFKIKLLRINRKSAYAAVEAGAIPGVVRIGRSIRVSRDAVLEWLRGQGGVSRSRRQR